jgi:hypothetical protein
MMKIYLIVREVQNQGSDVLEVWNKKEACLGHAKEMEEEPGSRILVEEWDVTPKKPGLKEKRNILWFSQDWETPPPPQAKKTPVPKSPEKTPEAKYAEGYLPPKEAPPGLTPIGEVRVESTPDEYASLVQAWRGGDDEIQT